MASKKLFTAHAARRFIKEECFSSFVSQKRLRSLQELLAISPEDDRPDALLCVTGIDSLYNEGCQELASYLLFGFFGERMRQIEAAGFEERVVEDVIILIKRNSVDVYCNPFNYPLILPYIAPWRNVRLHCMKQEEYDDGDKSEAFKITSFVAMVDNCHIIGLPFSCTNRFQEFDHMQLEKWPIVQSHALAESEGGKGIFLTLKYQVVDMIDVVHKVFEELDAVVFESLITEQLGNLETQCLALIQGVDAKQNDLTACTGTYIAEPVVAFFKHGRNMITPDEPKPDRKPFILIGKDTRKVKLEASSKTGKSSTDSIVTTNYPATHMVCQIVSPKNPLACRRTYFFSAGNHCRLTESYEGSKGKANDFIVLISIYMCCVKAVRDIIDMYKEVQDPVKLQMMAIKTMAETWNALRVPVGLSHLSNKENLEITIEAFDKNNRQLPPSSVQVGMVKSVSVSVFDVPSIETSGLNLGSVSFSESFMDSCVTVQDVNDSTYSDCEVLNLTSMISDYSVWPLSASEKGIKHYLSCIKKTFQHGVDADPEDLENARKIEQDLGKCLVAGENVHCINESTGFELQGNLFILEKAIIVADDHTGFLCLPLQDVEKLEYYDGDSPSAVNLLKISIPENLESFLPVQLRSGKFSVLISMDPKSKAAVQFFTNVLPSWKEMTAPIFNRVETLSDELTELHKKLQKDFDIKLRPSQNASLLKKKMNTMQNLQEFLSHLEASTTNKKPIPSKHVNVAVGRECDLGQFSDPDQLIVTILTGVTGSHKSNLCEALVDLAKEDSRWAVVRQPPDECMSPFSASKLQSSITSSWRAYRMKKSSSKIMRALVVSPGFTDTADIVKAITCHPDKVVASHLRIGAVTVCIDPENVYLRNHYPLPKLFDQCAHGWVNNILFTACTEPVNGEVHPSLNHIQNIVRAINPNVALLLAEGGKATRSTDIDLILSTDAFNADDLLRARYLSCPGWFYGLYDSGKIFPDMNEVIIVFKQALDRNRFTSRLRRAQLNHHNYPFLGNIYMLRGSVLFEKDPEMYDVRHSVLSKHFTLEACEASPNGKSYIIFTGVQLEKEALQHWLKQCFPFKPQKRVIRERSSLTKTEITRIEKKRHGDTLPEGWFYNGCQFVSLAGDRQYNHPFMDKFLEEYLQQENEKAAKYNNGLGDNDYENVFE